MSHRSAYADALDALRPLAERQHGLVTIRQLTHFAIDDAARRWVVERGLLVEERLGVYVCSGSPVSRARDVMAAVLAVGAGVWASHATATEMHELSLPK